MSTTRREFLARNAAGLSYLTLSGTLVPDMLFRTSSADAASEDRNRVLVVVELNGGNDGLNTVIPIDDPAYRRARPELAIRDGAHRISNRFALHPALGGVTGLFKEGKAAIVHGVGYPNPKRSHFRSMEIWHTARRDTTSERNGWLGSYLDSTVDEAGDMPIGIVFSEQLPQSLVASRANVPVIRGWENYDVLVEGGVDVHLRRRLVQELGSPAANSKDDDAPIDFLRRQARNTHIGTKILREASERFQPRRDYRGPLGRQLRMAGQVIAANLGTRIIHVSLGGFDTHANQAGKHAELLSQLDDALTQFLSDLAEVGRADDVLVVTYSEFGRRVKENASHGTDHGAASPMFFFGNHLQPGFHGEHPSLTELDDGDLVFSTDFRSLYQAILDDWLGTEASKVLGDKYPKIKLIEAAPA